MSIKWAIRGYRCYSHIYHIKFSCPECNDLPCTSYGYCVVDKCILCVISTMLNWLHKSFCQLMLPHPRSFFSIFSWVGELLKLHRIHDKMHVCFSYIRLALPLIHLNLYPATLSFSWLLSNPYITIEIVQGLLSIEIDKMNIKNKEPYNNLFTNFTHSEHQIYPFF